MLKHILFFVTLPALSLPLFAAGAESQEREYQQVRRIALRDPKVRAAYDDADRRLEAKMLQIDPALKTYVKTRGARPVQAKLAKPAIATKKVPAATHVVAKGETLGSIAVRYGVSVAALKAGNQIVDERKLRAGQPLVIPLGRRY